MRPCLFVVSVHTPADYSSSDVKLELNRELSRLFRSVRSTDVVVVSGHFRTQLDYLVVREQSMRGRFSVPADWTDSGGCLVQVCSGQRLFLVNTNFSRKGL